jgi:hypothetical protein
MSKVHLKSYRGPYVCAEGGGGGAVVANRFKADPWETFHLQNFTRAGALVSGDVVALQANNGLFLCAEGSGGGPVVANRVVAASWEKFVIERVTGGGPISGGDLISLRACDGHYVCAEGGGGREVVANRIVVADWESFQIEVIPETAFVVLQENSGRLEIESAIPEPLRSLLQEIIDKVAESFENVKSRIQAGGYYDRVDLLTDTACTRANLLQTLARHAIAGRDVDLVVLGHGGPRTLYLHNDEPLTAALIGRLQKDARALGAPGLSLRMVYTCNCYGSTVNDAWIAAGARVSVGPRELDVMPEPMTTYFFNDWLAGFSAGDAARRAYSASRALYAVDPFVAGNLLDQSELMLSGDPSVSSILPTHDQYAGWAAKSAGGFGTQDPADYIRFHKEASVGGDPNAVEFRLELEKGVTWKKIINMPDGGGSDWDIVAEGQGASASNGLYLDQCLNGQALTFRKAKQWGVMQDVLRLGDLGPLAAQGASRMVFRWVRDS